MKTYHAAVPDELPFGSVVLDRYGVAWQRRTQPMSSAEWLAPAGLFLTHLTALTWPTLLTTRGPVIELHKGTPE